ncbi:MAG: transcriptional repressor, partial [Rhodospirillaceae bacterium]|nr:transcriptional repressor [Rhodospirillaceae bacterium]
MTGFPEPNHDHHGCIDTALNRAERLCRTAGARLTESRRDILRLVWASHAPIGAYE